MTVTRAPERVELTPTEIDWILDSTFTEAETAGVVRELAALAMDAAQDAAAQVARDLGKPALVNENTLMLRVYRDRRAQVTAGINRTTRRRLQLALREAAARKATPPQLRAAVRGVFDVAKRVRAPAIAVQEAGTGWSVGGRAEMLLQGVPGRLWRTQQDDRVREAHEALDGECASIDEPFEDGDGNLLMFPRDPAAPPETVMQCRCFEEAIAGGCQSLGMRDRLNERQRVRAWWKAQDRALRGHERAGTRVMRRRFQQQQTRALALLEHAIR